MIQLLNHRKALRGGGLKPVGLPYNFQQFVAKNGNGLFNFADAERCCFKIGLAFFRQPPELLTVALFRRKFLIQQPDHRQPLRRRTLKFCRFRFTIRQLPLQRPNSLLILADSVFGFFKIGLASFG